MCNRFSDIISHHSFIPIDNNNFKMRRISNDIIYTLIELVKTPISNIIDIEYIMVGIFIGCRYDDLSYLGVIIENCDVKVKFMKRHDQGEEYYSWPHKDDICWIPYQDIIIIIINLPNIINT